MNTPVSFELAKMLKEKGFTSVFTAFSNKYYNSLGEYKIVSYDVKIENNEYEAPTIAEVVMWLYEKYGVWISIDMLFEEDQTGFWYCIRESKLDDVAVQSEEYSTPTEAYEAGIEYTLKNLKVC